MNSPSLSPSPYVFHTETCRYRSPFIALNSCGESTIIRSIVSDGDDESAFTIRDVEMQSRSEDGLAILVLGFKANVKLFKKKVHLSGKKSALVPLDWMNIDTLVFKSANDGDDDPEKKRFHFILVSVEMTSH